MSLSDVRPNYWREKEHAERISDARREARDRDELDKLNKRAHAYADQLRETYGLNDEESEYIIDFYNLDSDY